MPEKEAFENSWHEPLKVFAKTSGWVVGPVLVSLFLGRYLDAKFDSKPIIFIGLTGLAFMISCFGIYKETVEYMKNIEKNNDHTNNTHNNKS